MSRKIMVHVKSRGCYSAYFVHQAPNESEEEFLARLNNKKPTMVSRVTKERRGRRFCSKKVPDSKQMFDLIEGIKKGIKAVVRNDLERQSFLAMCLARSKRKVSYE